VTGNEAGFRVRACVNCAERAAERGSKLCWGCQNSGQDPPPCRICGSADYYCGGYCYPCHPRTLTARSCLGCLSWGRFAGYMCIGCAALRRKHGTGTCPGCSRDVPLDRGFCRLCRNQAILNVRSQSPWAKPDDDDRRAAARKGLQLFFAGMQRSLQSGQRRPHEQGTPCGSEKQFPRLRLVPASTVQLRLFDGARDVRGARLAGRDSVDPELSEYARGYIEDLATARGWSAATLEDVRAGALLMIAVHGRDERVRASTVVQLGERLLPVGPIREVLALLGLLDDDRADTLEAWISSQLDGLPGQIRDEVTAWLGELREGGPRSRPRADGTVHTYLGAVLPFLAECATRYSTLRQVTTSDLQEWVAKETAARHLRASAARSLFRVLKTRRLVFTDPARRLPSARRRLRVPVPLPPGTDALIGNAVLDSPRIRLVVALIGVHALTNSEITAIRVDDVSPHELMLAVRGSARPLEAFTASAIDGYLGWRRARWPRTANPHLIITRTTAGSTSQVDPSTIRRWLKGITTPTALRQSCLLWEAEVSGGDPLILASMFGIATQTSLRYTDAAVHHRREDHDPRR
jgi:site-specific recombinase XerD